MYDNALFSLGDPLCSVCNKPVSLDNAKTDEDGAAIHEACYLVKIGVGKPLSSPLKDPNAHLLGFPGQKRHWED
jgi:hypothetical protein